MSETPAHIAGVLTNKNTDMAAINIQPDEARLHEAFQSTYGVGLVPANYIILKQSSQDMVTLMKDLLGDSEDWKNIIDSFQTIINLTQFSSNDQSAGA